MPVNKPLLVPLRACALLLSVPQKGFMLSLEVETTFFIIVTHLVSLSV